VIANVSVLHPSPPEGAALMAMAMTLRYHRTVILAVAFCFLPCITSSLNLEDPNVCSHWERSVTALPPLTTSRWERTSETFRPPDV